MVTPNDDRSIPLSMIGIADLALKLEFDRVALERIAPADQPGIETGWSLDLRARSDANALALTDKRLPGDQRHNLRIKVRIGQQPRARLIKDGKRINLRPSGIKGWIRRSVPLDETKHVFNTSSFGADGRLFAMAANNGWDCVRELHHTRGDVVVPFAQGPVRTSASYRFIARELPQNTILGEEPAAPVLPKTSVVEFRRYPVHSRNWALVTINGNPAEHEAAREHLAGLAPWFRRVARKDFITKEWIT